MKKLNIIPLLFIALLICGCPAKKPEVAKTPAAAPPEPPTVEAIFAAWAERARQAPELEASLQFEFKGVALPVKGRLFGAIRIEQDPAKGASEVAIQIVAYLPLGLPGMELIARGDRFELFLPTERRVFLNAPEFKPEDPGLIMTNEQFSELMFPPEELTALVGLLWGKAAGEGRDYELESDSDPLVLIERRGAAKTRELYLAREGFNIERVVLFSSGGQWAEVEVSRNEGWPPSLIRVTQGEKSLSLRLSDIKAGPDVAGEPIKFREPTADEVIWVGSLQEIFEEEIVE